MAGKPKEGKGGKNKAKAKTASDAAAAAPDGKGCHACNFTGEVCRDCGEPQTGCECKTFAPIQCKACDPEAMKAAEHQPTIADVEAAMDKGEPVDIKPSGEVAIGLPPAGYDTADQPPGPDDADDAGLAQEETAATFPPEPAAEHHGQQQPAGDPELEKLVTESVQRRLTRLKQGHRRRHHTKQLSVRVLTGIIKAGEAAAQGGADGFFGRWCRNDLMAWEGLMDAAEWAQEELNAREFRRMKRESVAAAKTQEATAAT